MALPGRSLAIGQHRSIDRTVWVNQLSGDWEERRQQSPGELDTRNSWRVDEETRSTSRGIAWMADAFQEIEWFNMC